MSEAPWVVTIGTQVVLTDGSHKGWAGKVTFLVVGDGKNGHYDGVVAEVMFPDGSVVNAPRSWLGRPVEKRVPNGRAYVTRSVNMYMPAHRDMDGNVSVVFRGEWSTKGVAADTFIGDREADMLGRDFL
jgi:hypothetical protein